MPTTYKEAGVDIDAGDKLVDLIKPLVKKTSRPEVISPLGGYVGLFSLPSKKYKNPLLVATTDGVGTKLKLAFQLGTYQTVGVDLVAMSVNDLICCGAEPLFFLDYFATGKLEVSVAKEVIQGMTGALAGIHCTLLGGETAEMPGFYHDGEFDLAGFAVGVVEKNRMVNGMKVKVGDKLIGLPSSGLHSNGFSLVRRVLNQNGIDPAKDLCGLSRPIGLELLTPTKIYVNPVLALLKKFPLKAIAHITGGGLIENLPRVFPKNLSAVIERSRIKTPKIFETIRELGGVPEEEMWRVFNMGVGMVMIVRPADEKAVIAALAKLGYSAASIGEMTKKKPGQKGVKLC